MSGLAKKVTTRSKYLISNIANLMAEQKNLINYNIVKRTVQNVQNKYITQTESF